LIPRQIPVAAVALLNARNMIAGMKSHDHKIPKGAAMIVRFRLGAFGCFFSIYLHSLSIG
jgi:hypothetical protein